jgi:hypothetical protein
MIFVYKDIYVDQGATFTQDFQVKDSTGAAVDISTYTNPTVNIKHFYGTAEGVTASIAVKDATTGLLTVTIPATETAKMNYSRGVYTIKITASAATLVLYSGQVIVSENI